MRNFFIAEDILNFHNHGPLTSFDIEKIFMEFIEDAYNNQYESVLIITGRGRNSPKSPVVRPKIEKLLKSHNLIRSFKRASSENGGEGAFEVFIKE